MLSLPVYLRAGTYYLHTRVGRHQFKRSLKTADPVLARLRALELLRVIEMSKPKLSDFKFDSEELRRYEIELKGVRIKSDGPDDHARAMEAIKALSSLPDTPHTPKGATSLRDEMEPVTSPNGLTVTELLNRYLQMKQLATGSVSAVQNTVLQFAIFVGKKKTIDQVLKVDVTRFAEKMKADGLALQTVQTKINLLKAVFNFAREYSYLKGENPVSLKVITKAQKMAAGYDIFDDADIVAVYAKSYFDPQKIKDPDYFYVCLIAVITGLRIGAITSLCKNDIQKTDAGTWFLRIRDDKTANGKRDVPVIPELMGSGFESYIATKTGPIFKYSELAGRGKGNAVGKKFTRRLGELGLKNRKLVFHSLRKYANDYYAKSGVALEARSQFFGHELDNTNVNYYTKPYSIEALFEVVAQAQQKIFDKLYK